MAKMNNYFFVDARNRRRMINPENFTGRFCLSGIITGRKGFDDGMLLKTSPIVSIENNTVTTASGSKYELDEVSPDYMDFLDALEKSIPIISSWGFLNAHAHPSKLFHGYMPEGQHVKGEISEQNGNYITFKSGSICNPLDGSIKELNNTTFFVIWSTWKGLEAMPLYWDYTGLNYPDDYEDFAGYTCKPKLFKK